MRVTKKELDAYRNASGLRPARPYAFLAAAEEKSEYDRRERLKPDGTLTLTRWDPHAHTRWEPHPHPPYGMLRVRVAGTTDASC